MRRRTGTLARLGAGALTVATISLGVPALVASPAAAANATEQLRMVPVNATNNAVDNGCQEYRVTATNAQWDSSTEDGSVVYNGIHRFINQPINVILNPSAGINSQFCDIGDGAYVTNGNQGAGLPDQAQFTLDNHDVEFNQEFFEFGINEANLTPGAGSIGVQAYFDANGNGLVGSGEPQTAATDTILAGDPGAPANANQQSDLADTLTASPVSRNAASDNTDDFVTYKVVASHGTGTLQGVDLNYQIVDKQGDVTHGGSDTNVSDCESGNPDYEANNDNGMALDGGLSHNPANDGSVYDTNDETDGAGVAYCFVTAPLDMPASGSNNAQSGPYAITFFVPQSCAPPSAKGPVDTGTCHEPTADVTLNTFKTPDHSSSVRPTCGGSNTSRNSPKVCFELPKAQSETFTGQAIDDVTGQPEANTIINWGLDYLGECDKYTHGCDSRVVCFGNQCQNSRPGTAARPNGRSSPSFSEADNWTGTGGMLTRYYRTAGDAVGVARMPEDCVTKSDGTCSVTLHLNAPPADGAAFAVVSALNDVRINNPHNAVYGGATDLVNVEPYIGGNDCSTASDDGAPTFFCGRSVVEFSRDFTPGDTNIHVTRSAPSAQAGHFLTVTGHITNQFGNPITYQDPVAFHVKGGVFPNGTTQQVVQSDDTGRAQIAVTRTSHGKAKVTAVIGGGASNFTTLCGTHAGHSVDGFNHLYYAPNAHAGNCQASTLLHFHGKAKPQVERPHLTAGAVHHHHVRLTAQTNPSLGHVKVKFYRKTASGLKKLVGAHHTNSSGVAHSKVHAKAGQKFVCKVVGLGSLFKSKFSNRVTV